MCFGRGKDIRQILCIKRVKPIFDSHSSTILSIKLQVLFILLVKISVVDPDQEFQVNPDPDPDPEL